MANILLAMPTAGDVKVATVESIFSTTVALNQAGHQTHAFFYRGSELVSQRNIIATAFLQHEVKFTHLLFIDSDMSFDKALVSRMLKLDKPLVGAIYPQKKLDLARLIELARTSDRSPEKLIAASQSYAGRIFDKKSSVVEGACRVDAVGCGVMLVARTTLQEMIDRDIVKMKRDDDSTRSLGLKGLYGFFDHISDGLEYTPEDFSFCRRWSEGCGGEIWAIVDSDVGHVGDFRFGGSFLNSR